MENQPPSYQSVLMDFREARLRAALQEVLGRVTGKSAALLSYDDVAHKLGLTAGIERGVQPIPLNAIIGSVGRYSDFTRTFLPRRSYDRDRWAGVKLAFFHANDQPPIEVYKVGEAYFVLDGNHRVSVALQEGRSYIDAHVVEIQTDVPLGPGVSADDLIVKAQYAGFLRQTGLAAQRPNVDLSLTAPGQYERLEEQIVVERDALSAAQGREVSLEQASLNWYDEVYTPAAETIRERGLLRWFPGRTVTDLYLWVSEHRERLEKELGWDVTATAAMTHLAANENARARSQEVAPGTWRSTRLAERYTDRLFQDVLVALSGEPGSWPALAQALAIARREGARLHGLHVVASEAQIRSAQALTLRTRFDQQCTAAGVVANLALEPGDVARQINERALLADLVVLHLAHPPASGLSGLGSRLRNIIWRSARPILAVPGEMSDLENALLAFDGSPKAKEALFVAAYVAERWHTKLTVLTLRDKSRATPAALEYARDYLDIHELEADYVLVEGGLDETLKVMEERNIDLLLMGGYSVSAFEEVVAGSMVNFMLREARCPIFICR